MKLSELRSQLMQELCSEVPDGTRLIEHEVGGMVMSRNLGGGQLKIVIARNTVRAVIACLDLGDDDELNRENVVMVQQGAESYFSAAEESALSDRTRGLAGEDRETVRGVLERVLNSMTE